MRNKTIEFTKNDWSYIVCVGDTELRYAMVIDEENMTYSYGEITLIQPTNQELMNFIYEMHERENQGVILN